jgi:hypothetical protein
MPPNWNDIHQLLQRTRDSAASLIPHFTSHGSGAHPGIEGTSDTGIGVVGSGREGVFGVGDDAGVSGYSQSGVGVQGDNQSNAAAAVLGTCRDTAAGGTGVLGQAHHGRGVAGLSERGQGVYGHSNSQAGVVGESEHFHGVFGATKNVGAVGVYGSNPGGFAGYFEGDVTVTGNIDITGPNSDIRLTNGDCAEDFDVCGKTKVEPGSVMVLSDEGELSVCHQGYDKRVAGVISGAGDYKPAIVLDSRKTSGNRQPIALLGKVFCKVDAQFGAIGVGDLLTTSPTPGHAMAVSEPSRAVGAIIGKALRPLSSGEGLIPILVGLQ